MSGYRLRPGPVLVSGTLPPEDPPRPSRASVHVRTAGASESERSTGEPRWHALSSCRGLLRGCRPFRPLCVFQGLSSHQAGRFSVFQRGGRVPARYPWIALAPAVRPLRACPLGRTAGAGRPLIHRFISARAPEWDAVGEPRRGKKDSPEGTKKNPREWCEHSGGWPSDSVPIEGQQCSRQRFKYTAMA